MVLCYLPRHRHKLRRIQLHAKARRIRWGQTAVFGYRSAGDCYVFFQRDAGWGGRVALGPWDGGQGVAGVLAVWRVAAAVGDDGYAGGFGDSGDLGDGGEAAYPVDVGLEDVD